MQHKLTQIIFLRSFCMWSVIRLLQSPAVGGPDSRHFARDAARNKYCAADLLFEVQRLWSTLAAAALSRGLLECGLSQCTRSGRSRFISKIIIRWRVRFALLFIIGRNKSVLWAVFSSLKLWLSAFSLQPNKKTSSFQVIFKLVC